MSKGHKATGTLEGTGAAIDIPLGFIPKTVRVINQDGIASLEWSDTMPAASGYKDITAGTRTFITLSGISAYAGTAAGAGAGFTIGADTDINVSGETIHWIAEGEDA